VRRAVLSLSIGLLAVAVALRLLLAWDDLGRVIFGFCDRMDDCFYYFQIARSVAGGGPVAPDGVLATNGFHPLWLLLLVPLYRVPSGDPALPVHLALSLCVALWVGSSYLWFLIARQLGFSRTLSVAVLALYSLSLYSIEWSVNGLETSLALLLFAWFLYAVIRASQLSRWSVAWVVAIGLLTGLLALARTDYWITILVMFAYQVARSRRRPGTTLGWLTALAFGVLVFCPWPIWSWLTFGSPIQVSAVAYPYYRHANWLAAGGFSWRRLAVVEIDKILDLLGALARYSSLGRAGLAVAVAAVIATATRDTSTEADGSSSVSAHRALTWASVGVLCQIGLSVVVRWVASDWYFAPAIFVFWLWLLFPADLLRRGSRPALALVFLVAALGAAFAWEDAQRYRDGGRYAGLQREITQKYAAMPDRVIGVSDSGWVGYFAPQRVVNLDGKVNNSVFEVIRDGGFVGYLQSAHIRYAEINPIVMATVRRTEPRHGLLQEVAPSVFRLQGDEGRLSPPSPGPRTRRPRQGDGRDVSPVGGDARRQSPEPTAAVTQKGR
jgi:hypothetical protein